MVRRDVWDQFQDGCRLWSPLLVTLLFWASVILSEMLLPQSYVLVILHHCHKMAERINS